MKSEDPHLKNGSCKVFRLCPWTSTDDGFKPQLKLVTYKIILFVVCDRH